MFRPSHLLRSAFVDMFKGVEMGRKFVSLGGWCGPALILGRLGLRTEAYPLDFSRVTLDGLIHFIENGFEEGFYPPGPKPYRPECVGIYVLFRGQHTAFAHFDLNDEAVQLRFEKKVERFNRLIDYPSMPVTFFRTVTAQDPLEELSLASALEAALVARNPNLSFRIVFMVHEQGLLARAVELAPLSERMSLWALSYQDKGETLFDKCSNAYTDIVLQSLEESNWPLTGVGEAPSPVGLSEKTCCFEKRVLTRNEALREKDVSFEDLTVDRFPWRHHTNLALIDGVASVGGTCTGIGSTRMDRTPEGHSLCRFCGNTNYHHAGKPFVSDRPFTEEEDQLILFHLYRILTGGDKIEEVETLAHEMKRGVFEVICRIQFLTDSSTKIAEGLHPLLPTTL